MNRIREIKYFCTKPRNHLGKTSYFCFEFDDSCEKGKMIIFLKIHLDDDGRIIIFAVPK